MKLMEKIEVRRVPLGCYEEFHLVLKDLDYENNFLSEILSALEKESILPIRIAFFGDAGKLEEAAVSIGKRWPCSIVGDSTFSQEKANVHIKGVKILTGQSQKVEMGSEVLGYHFNFPDFEYLDIGGACFKNKPADFGDEVKGEYEKINRILKHYEFPPGNIYRFWNFIMDIDGNYPAFNKVRDAYFKKNSILKFSAATGIEAEIGREKRINLGLEAIRPKESSLFRWETVSSDMQSEAYDYLREVSGLLSGPKFSRAVVLDFPAASQKKIYISGTSSVNRKGESIFPNDMEKNVEYVLQSFGHLLEKNGFSWNDLVSVYVYCKNKKAFEAFEKAYSSKKFNFSYNLAFTNICRGNFLFEIEGIAAKSSKEIIFSDFQKS